MEEKNKTISKTAEVSRTAPLSAPAKVTEVAPAPVKTEVTPVPVDLAEQVLIQLRALPVKTVTRKQYTEFLRILPLKIRR